MWSLSLYAANLNVLLFMVVSRGKGATISMFGLVVGGVAVVSGKESSSYAGAYNLILSRSDVAPKLHPLSLPEHMVVNTCVVICECDVLNMRLSVVLNLFPKV